MSDRFARLETLYHAARAMPPEKRAKYLADECGADEEMRREVESMLAPPGFGVVTSIVDKAPALATGTVIGTFRIIERLGVGGMGEVYRAHDTNLERDVAVKVLPQEFASDRDRLARLEREARLLASLNHPNIAHAYGLEESNGTRALVMELIEGDTLADRIADGAIPLGDAVPIARQVASALAAAHDRGIIHRDLKPANIKLQSDGTVKVLDFGLAKAVDAILESTATQPGAILGTVAYMSPEQAAGNAVDRRTDLWAFGVVLMEMLTGRRVFEGDSIAHVYSSVRKGELDWSDLPADTPMAVRRLLRRCLVRDPMRRLDSAAAACLELDDASSAANPAVSEAAPTLVSDGAIERSAEQTRPAVSARAHLTWILACLLTAGSVWAITAWAENRASITAPPEMRLDIVTPPTTDPVSLALSPDGQKIVFVATSANKPMLWLRRLADEASARPLPGTEYASMPFWAPNGHEVGYFANSRIDAVDIDTGSIRRISSFAIVPAGATWNADGIVLFPRVPDSPLYRTSIGGGVGTKMQNLEPQDVGHRDPVFLPDGRHFLYYVAGDARLRGIWVGDLDGAGSYRLVDDADSGAVYAATGHLLFVRQGTLFAQRLFYSERWQLSGSPSRVADRMAFGGAAALSASAAGPIAYRTGTRHKRQLVWFDRGGHPLKSVGEPERGGPGYMSMSPDRQSVAIQRSVDGNVDIWQVFLDGRAVRLTTNPRPDIAPVFSPGGDRIAFAKGVTGFDLYQLSIASGEVRSLLESNIAKQPTDWSRNGYLLYRTLDQDARFSVWALQPDGDRTPVPVVQPKAGFDARDAQFSPDGKWVAYQANDSGRYEVYVQPFRAPGAPRPISRDGGAQVRWREDGKELFYIAPDGQLMAVPFDATRIGHEVGPADHLFLTHVGAFEDVSLPHYVPSHNGQRFLMDTVVEENAAPITVILNWKPPTDEPKGLGR